MKAMKSKSNIKMASHDAKTNSLNDSAAGLDLQLLGTRCNQNMVGSISNNKFRLLQLFYDKKKAYKIFVIFEKQMTQKNVWLLFLFVEAPWQLPQ
jgi:hypothetical protein